MSKILKENRGSSSTGETAQRENEISELKRQIKELEDKLQTLSGETSDQKTTEKVTEELETQTILYDSLFENCTDIVEIYDAEGNFIWANPQWEKRFEADRSRIGKPGGINLNILKPKSEYMKRAPIDKFREVFEGKCEYHAVNDYKVSETFISQKEEVSTLKTKMIPIKGKDSKVKYVMIIHQDITDSEKSKLLLNNIIDSVPNQIVAYNDQGYIILWNNITEKTTGIPPSDAIGKSLKQLIKNIPFSKQQYHEAIAEGKTHTTFRTITDQEGNVRNHKVSISPIFSNLSDEIHGAVEVTTDITEDLRIKQTLQELERSAILGGLVAGISHDLRNPLGVICSSVSLTKRRTSNPESLKKIADKLDVDISFLERFISEAGIDRALEAISVSADRIKDHITDILGFSKKDSSVEFGRHELDAIINKSVQFAGYSSGYENDLSLSDIKINKSFKATGSFFGKEGHLVEVLINLLQNSTYAINEKYGSIKVRQPEQAYIPQIDILLTGLGECNQISVKDNGIGIGEDKLCHVFEREFSTKIGRGGSGLGLYISKHLIEEVYEGKLQCESEYMKGTTFTILLPGVETVTSDE